MALQSQKLFYPISDLPSVDFTKDTLAWNQNSINAATFDGKVYGFSVGYGEGDGVFFNKRLLEEAGISPDAPYDMQKDGTWTWENFLDMCKKVTRDTDNDGNIDVYAIAPNGGDTLNDAVWSNGANYVEKDATGKFVNASTRPEFLQALQFTVSLNNEKVLMPQPEGSEWNWYERAFYEGKSVFWPAPTWQVGNVKNNLSDDYGLVMFPKGPSSTDYCNAVADSLMCIPSTFSAQEADDIMFAYQLWVKPVEGYNDPDSWKSGAYQNYRDERAVDETLAMMHSGNNTTVGYHNFVTGLNIFDIADNMWKEGADPAQLIESAGPKWNALIDEVNNIQ
jgi:ABC-type glycerol-3-phosphate transport system substrate-binding protein